jgi:hypothetical protein
MEAKPAPAPEPKRSFPWFRVGSVALALLLVVMATPFFHTFRLETSSSICSFDAKVALSHPTPQGVTTKVQQFHDVMPQMSRYTLRVGPLLWSIYRVKRP